MLGSAVRQRLERHELARFDRGELVLQRPRMVGSNLCTAYHPRDYVTDTLLAQFSDVEAFELGTPDLALLQDAYIARR